MSTRGLYGIRKDGKDKLTYNHFDSYPEGLGLDIIRFCTENSDTMLEKFYDSIVLLNGHDRPSEEDIKECVEEGIYSPAAYSVSEVEWFDLLGSLAGDFDKYEDMVSKNKKVYMIDNRDFIENSLFCEYAYILNLDDKTLEFYKGFQTKPQPGNRYGTEKDTHGYYPCRMVAVIPFEKIRTESPNDIISMMTDE